MLRKILTQCVQWVAILYIVFGFYFWGSGTPVYAAVVAPENETRKVVSLDYQTCYTKAIGDNPVQLKNCNFCGVTFVAVEDKILFCASITNQTLYTTDTVWLRRVPSTEKGNELILAAGTEVFEYANSMRGWSIIKYNNEFYYIWNEHLAADPVYDATDLRYLSSIIFAEAGNQCEAGKQAVGIIVMNRMEREDAFADTVKEVIYEKGQFTPASNGSLNSALSLYDKGELPEECVEAAKYALQGNKTVNYNSINYDLTGYYFFSRYVAGARLTIQDHDFK